MFGGNPNVRANPFQPMRFDKSPLRQGYTNPYGYGLQRTLGQLAPQPNAWGMGQGNNSQIANPFMRGGQQNWLEPWLAGPQRRGPYGY